MESQLVVFKLSNGRLIPALSANTALYIMKNGGSLVKRPAIEINVGELISSQGLVVGKYVYTLTEIRESIAGRTEAREDYV